MAEDFSGATASEMFTALVPKEWGAVESLIRPESRGDFVLKAKVALMSGLPEAAMNYIWDSTIDDLRAKVVAFGVEYFAEEMNLESVKDQETLVLYANDYFLIEGCYRLNIINKEAWFQLQHCRQLRNHFSAAHPPAGEVDPLEVLNFCKNCAKYVLREDRPLPGFSMKNLLDNIKEGDISGNIQEIQVGLLGQPTNTHNTLCKILFAVYIDNASSGQVKANVEKLAPIVWERSDENARMDIGAKYAKIAVEGSSDKLKEAFAFLRVVGGVQYIPTQLLKVYFEKAANDLIEAHNSFDNFHLEPSVAAYLCDLGFSVPQGSEQIYVKAVMLSFIGNPYGLSWNAQNYNITMIANFNQRCLNTLFKILESDRDLILELLHEKPLNRLKDLCELLEGRSIPSRYVQTLQKYKEASIDDLKKYFSKRSVAP